MSSEVEAEGGLALAAAQFGAEATPLLPTGAPLFPTVPPPTGVTPFLDPYSEDSTDYNYLSAKPTCIIFVGKPGSGRSMLAKRLAKEWNFCYVHPRSLIERHIPQVSDESSEGGEAVEAGASNSEDGEDAAEAPKGDKAGIMSREEEAAGIELRRLLFAGEEISDQLVFQIIKEKMSSPEVGHYGYVLDEFPTLSEKLYSVEKQMEMIKSFPSQPDFIVHVKISDEDLVKRRKEQRVDPVSGNIYPKMIYDPDENEAAAMKTKTKVNDPEEDDTEEEEGEDGGYDSDDMDEIANDLPFDPREITMKLTEGQIQRLLKRPEDDEDNIKNTLKVYQHKMLPLLQEFMADHDQSRVFELDGNRSNTYLFNGLKARLKMHNVHPPVSPVQLLDPDNENEEIPEEVDTEELILKLNSVRMLAPRFRWQRSRWLRMCPVELARGNVVQGKPEFAVGFLDKLYILSSQEALELFIQNPRRFLLPPQPRFPVKLAVIGPSLSGRTTLAYQLAEFYSATILDMNSVLRPAIESELQQQNDELRAQLLQDAVIQVKNRILSVEQQTVDQMTGIVLEREVDALVEADVTANVDEYLDPFIVMTEAKREAEEEEARRLEEMRRKLSDEEFELLREKVLAEEAKEENKEKWAERRRREAAGQPLNSLQSLDMMSESSSSAQIDEETGEQSAGKVEPPTGLKTAGESGFGGQSTTPGAATAEDRVSTAGDGSDFGRHGAGEGSDAGMPNMGASFKSQGARTPESGLGRYGEGFDAELHSPGYGGQEPDMELYALEREEMEVSENHPEVQLLLRELMDEHKQTYADIVLSPDKVVELVKERILLIEEERLKKSPEQSRHGGWILDNFPQSKDVWLAFINDPIITPVEVVRLRESDPQTNIFLGRWWAATGSAIWASREAAKRQLDDVIEEEEEIDDIAPSASSASETDGRGGGGGGAGGGPGSTQLEQQQATPTHSIVRFQHNDADDIPDAALEDFIELEDFRSNIREFDADWPQILSILRDNGIEPMIVDVDDKTSPMMVEEIDEKITEQFSKDEEDAGVKYEHRAWEFQGQDLDQEEEDLEQDAQDEAAAAAAAVASLGGGRGGRSSTDDDSDEDEGEGGDSNQASQTDWVALTYNLADEEAVRMRKRFLGDTKHFCPVALRELGVLWPGDYDKAAVFRNKIYFFSKDEARDKFIKNPKAYVADEEPLKAPPLRVMLIGPKGSGKTVHGRAIARKFGIIHVSFREKLEEIILLKHGKRTGPEYDDEEEEEEEEEDEEEEEEDEDEVDNEESPNLDAETGEEVSIESGSGVQRPALRTPPVPVTLSAGDVPAGAKAATQCACPPGEESDKEEIPVRTVPSVTFSIPIVQDPRTPLSREPRSGSGADGAAEGDEMNEYESAILAYLTDASGSTELPEEIIDEILAPYWHKEPYKSHGFILEGFPSTPNEAKLLSEKGFYPDCCIVLQVDEKDVLARLIPPMMDRWQARMDRKRTRQREEKEKARRKYEAEREKKRQELIKEFRAKGEEERAEDEEEMMNEIEQMLNEDEGEDDDEEGEEEEATPEDAHEKYCMKIQEWYDQEMSHLEEVQKNLSEDYWIPCLEVDGARQPHIVRYTMQKKLRPLTENRLSLFERCYPLTPQLATKMITQGYRKPSKFGSWCPVALMDGACLVPPPGTPFPLLFRSHVYSLSSAEARDRFAENPIRFVRQNPPKPMVPLKLAVVGPPKAGKTTLASHIETLHGVPRVSVGDALRDLLENQPKVFLTSKVREYLHQGLTVPDDLAVRALDIYLLEERFSTRGWVLDGYPLTQQQLQLMDDSAIIPLKLIELQLNEKEMMARGSRDRMAETGRVWSPSLEDENANVRVNSAMENDLSSRTDVANNFAPAVPQTDRPEFVKHNSSSILAFRRATYESHVGAVRDFYRAEEQSWSQLDGAKSKWWVRHHALEEALKIVRKIQEYLFRVAKGLAASLDCLCVRPEEFVARLGIFRQYCPVALTARGELENCEEIDSLQFAVEYRGVYYKTCGPEELALFLSSPSSFLPPVSIRRLPDDPDFLPQKRTAAWAKRQYPWKPELLGYCPVTFMDGKLRYEAIIPGSPELVVEYRRKFWFFVSPAHRDRFMRLPHLYWNLVLPKKLPPKKLEPIHVTGLPMLGYMEQAVASCVIKANTAVGTFKPKYPFLTPTRSALLYVAFHLKAHNPKSTDYIRKKYKKKLARFEEICDIIAYLGSNMGPRYVPPQQRPLGFDTKMETFFGLKNLKATRAASWLK